MPVVSTATKKRPWFFPAELAVAYDFPDGDGTGQTIGLLEFGGGYFPDDLAAFGKAAGLASLPTVVPISAATQAGFDCGHSGNNWSGSMK